MLLVLVMCTFALSAGLDSRIYRGQDLRPDVHSYLVKLEIYQEKVIICSGSIISSSWIITAAHCVTKNFSKLIVYHLSVNKAMREIAVVNKFDTKMHPQYCTAGIMKCSSDNFVRDVALIYLRKQLLLSGYIVPITLANFNPNVGEMGTIAGYGYHESDNKAPREGTVVIDMSYIEGGIHTRGTAWVGHGDSGGPLIIRGRLAGVISTTCDNAPLTLTCLAEYASVAANLNWIQRITNSNV